MDQDARNLLKTLGKQAKQAAEAEKKRQAESRAAGVEAVDFARQMGKVEPIKNSGRYVPPRDKAPMKPRAQERDLTAEADYFYVGSATDDEPPASFSKNGQGKNDIQRLRNGYWPVVADVDLHGYTQDQAQQVLNEFIEFTRRRGVCGEIVHGSGLGSSGYRPVLKNTVRRWLMQHPDVLAYVEPRPGNDGAVRILLKRRRPQWEEE